MNEDNKSKYDKLEEYHYNAYRNLIKILIFLDAAGITAVMATFGLKNNSCQSKAVYFANMNKNFEQGLNSVLNYFLLSLLMIIICVAVEYLSYWSRKKVLLQEESKLDCEFCKFQINFCVAIEVITLSLSYLFLILAGIMFTQLP